MRELMATLVKKRCACAGLLCLLALTLTSAPALGAGKATKRPEMQKISLLYALNAGAGRLTPMKGKGARYKLVLKGLDRNVTWFSDRPTRKSDSFPISGLAEAWKGFGFTADPPNAALTYTDKSGNSGRTVIVELTDPRYAKSKLSFVARVIDPESVKSPNLAQHAAGADHDPAHTLTDASLFIDDAEAPVYMGCVFQPHTTCVGVDFADDPRGHIDVFNVELQGSDFSHSDFADSSLSNTNLTEANLTDVSFEDASMLADEFQHAELTGATLNHGLFKGANFEGANLTGATYAGANFFYATFANATADLGRLIYEGGLLCKTITFPGFEANDNCSENPPAGG